MGSRRRVDGACRCYEEALGGTQEKEILIVRGTYTVNAG